MRYLRWYYPKVNIASILYGNNESYLFSEILKKIADHFPNINSKTLFTTKSLEGSFPPSVLIIKSTEVNGKIKLNQLPIVKDHCSTSFSQQKVCFIHQIDNATLEFQNGILKLLEEDEKTIFFLSATSITRVLPTILSRGTMEVLSPKTTSVVEKIISSAKSYNIHLTEEEIVTIENSINNQGFIWVASKTQSINLPKYILIWEHILLQDIQQQNKVGQKKFIYNLMWCDKYLNQHASKIFSKTLLEMMFFSNIKRV